MEIRFKILFEVEARHEFHAGAACADLRFIAVPGDPAWAGGRLLRRERDGRLIVLGESDGGGAQPWGPADRLLWLGLQARDPAFANYTLAPVADGHLPLYRNAASPLALDPPLAVQRLARRQRVVPQRPERPLQLRWLRMDVPGEPQVAMQELQVGEESVECSTLDWPAGLYRLEEHGAAPPAIRYWVRQPAWDNEALWGMLAVRLAPEVLAAATPVTLSLTLAARREKICYYVVAPDLLPAEFAQLALHDDDDPPLAFERIESNDLPAEDLLGLGLASETAQVALFRSLAETPRLARGYPRLQLRRGNEILFQRLPQAGSSRPQAQFIIHLAKS